MSALPMLFVVALTVTVGIGIGGCAAGGATAAARGDVTGDAGATPAEEHVPAAADTVVDQRPHPDFDLTLSELEALTAEAPPAVRRAILARPQAFLENAGALLTVPADALARADKESALPADYEPPDLVPLDRYADRWILNRAELSLRGLIIPDLAAMVEAARLDGILLDISSSYRSYAYQENLFAYWVEELGQEEAERVSARAGTSQHQLGTTVDFGSVTAAFADHPAGRWLAEHAWEYGFSLSYPDGYEALTGYAYEPWHFRWISRAGTRMEREYFGGLQQHLIEFWEHARPALAAACDTCVPAP